MSGKVAPYIVQNGLIFYLDAANKASYDGVGNEWKDLSPNRINGIITGATFDTTDGISSFAFNGSSDYISGVDTAGILDISARGQSTTIEVGTLPTINTAGFLFLYGPTYPNSSYGVINTGYLPYPLIAAYTGSVGNTSIGYSTDSWNCISMCFNGSSAERQGYYNGQLANFSLLQGLIRSTGNNNWYVGANPVASSYFDGRISYVRIYNRVLSAAEILQNYNALKHRFN